MKSIYEFWRVKWIKLSINIFPDESLKLAPTPTVMVENILWFDPDGGGIPANLE